MFCPLSPPPPDFDQPTSRFLFCAWLLTDEAMTTQEWLGGGMILLAAYGVAIIAAPQEN